MPLWKTCGKRSRRHNIRLMMHEGRPQKQSVAIALEVERRAGCGTPGRDAGTFVLVAAVIVGSLLLLRPLFKDAQEQHRWSMENDPAYRKSHQAMEVAGAAKNIANLFSGQSSGTTGRNAGQRVASRTDVNKILAKHFRSHPRYRDLSMGERQRLYLLAGALIDSGASATDALAITHGMAHDPSRRLVLEKILEQGARATADDILKGRIKVRPLLPRS